MSNVTPFKPSHSYDEHIIVKDVDGEKVECVDIDSMSEEQFKQYCRDSGTEWFQRMTIRV